MFSRVASLFSVIKEYLEIIDLDFITFMNQKVTNIFYLTNPTIGMLTNTRIRLEDPNNEEDQITRDNKDKIISLSESGMPNDNPNSQIHMY